MAGVGNKPGEKRGGSGGAHSKSRLGIEWMRTGDRRKQAVGKRACGTLGSGSPEFLESLKTGKNEAHNAGAPWGLARGGPGAGGIEREGPEPLKVEVK